MELSVNSKKVFELSPKSTDVKVQGNIFSRGRLLIGRAESCDIVIAHPSISAIHAILEVTPQGIKLYDMNSRNGCFVNGNKIVAQSVNVGDKIQIASIDFSLREYADTPELPPILESLDPVSGMAHTKNQVKAQIPEKKEVEEKKVEEEIPYIAYPLATDPNADRSEYIFEDAKEIYPIFKYDVSKFAVEITILFKDQVFSVDYLPHEDAIYQIVGAKPKKKDIEFPSLRKEEKLPFVEIKKDYISVNKLPGYQALKLGNEGLQEVSQLNIDLNSNDIIKFVNKDLEIFVRRVAAPPKVKPAPFFRRDNEMKKYFFILFLILIPALTALQMVEVDKEELENDKAPERIATILYKQTVKPPPPPVVPKKVEALPKKVTKVAAPKPTPPKPQPPKVAQKAVEATSPKTAPKDTRPMGSKTAPKGLVKKANNPTQSRPTSARVAGGSPNPSASSASTMKANTSAPSAGSVDVYRSADFSSTVSSLVAKGGSVTGAQTAGAVAGTGGVGPRGATIGGGTVTPGLPRANVSTDIGSLEGSTVGTLAVGRGAEGLAAKTGIYTAGIPAETVVLGSMDPDDIRRILRENIPQFRYCYQKELETNAGSDISGTIRLLFTIGASGSVSRAGVDGNSALPAPVRNCVVNVLRGIQFPRPMGGGTVEVKQPFNFMSQRM